MKSIQAKFLTIVISSLLALTCAVGAISLLITHQVLLDDADVVLGAVCQHEAARINSTLNDVQRSVQIMESYALSALNSPQALENVVYRETYTTKMQKMFSNIAANTDGLVSFYLRFQPELTTPTAGFFVSAEPGGKKLLEVPTTDLSLYAPDDTEHVGWYYEAVNAGNPVWMEPYDNLNNDILMVSYVIPLYKDQTLVGVVGMDIDFSVLTQQVDGISVYENSLAYLAAQDGTVIHSREPLEDAHDSRFFKDRRAQTDAQLVNGMSLIIQARYADILRNGAPMLAQIFLAFAGVLLLAILVTIALTRKLVQPLKKLTVAAKQLAEGNVNVELDCESPDEIGTLSRVFLQTAEKLKEYMSYINALAYRDSLTGVKNMTAYTEAAAEMERKLQYSTPEFAVLVADVNNLKLTNDTYGHDIGSQVIVRASRVICDTFKRSPVFRIGGDEFAVILENRDFAQYRDLIQELDEACKQNFVYVGDTEIPVSIARGVAVYRADIDRTFEDVFKLADHAMYLHKQTFKDTPEA